MTNYIKRYLSKSTQENDVEIVLPKEAYAIFELKIDHLVVATLRCENSEWAFQYTDEFKSVRNK